MITFETVKQSLIEVRGQRVLLDKDVAAFYGVETKRVNEAVKNNPDKFPKGYVLELNNEEITALRSKISTANISRMTRTQPRVFTEKGLYMLATILKSPVATQTTIAIIEAFAKVRELARTIGEMSKNPDEYAQKSLMQRSGEIISDLFDNEMQTTDTETEIELNFAVLKLRHTIKRKKE